MKNDYNNIVKKHNFSNENRETLEEMVEGKNSEIDILKSKISQKDAIVYLLLWFLYSNDRSKNPKKEELINAL